MVSFGAVGAFAAGVHFLVATLVVEVARMPPQSANVIGYACALGVSWLGQSRLTFAGAGRSGLAPLRFVATSLAGFGLNALGFGALLRWTTMDYRLALLLVLGTVAASTWLALRHWVFPGARTGYA